MERPLKLTFNNGEGLIFHRTIALDENYMFTVTDEVENRTKSPVALYPYNLISRHGTPVVAGLYFMHEGLFGVTDKLHEVKYSELAGEKNTYVQQAFDDNGGWLGITDKYWATALIPDQKHEYQAPSHVLPSPAPPRAKASRLVYVEPRRGCAPGESGSVDADAFRRCQECQHHRRLRRRTTASSSSI